MRSYSAFCLGAFAGEEGRVTLVSLGNIECRISIYRHDQNILTHDEPKQHNIDGC